MASQIQIRRDTAANWTSSNPTLADGEIGYEKDTDQLKIGDGVTSWSSLSYLAGLNGADGADGSDGAPGADGSDGADGTDGEGVPVGGTTGQILAKASGDDYDTEWVDNEGGGGGVTIPQSFQVPDPDGAVMSIDPPVATGGYLQNLPFWINGYETTNAPNLTKNFVVTMGHNLAPGGGRVDNSDSAIGLSFEQRYDAGDLGAGGLPLTEHHTFFVAKTSTTGINAGQQVRIASYTINKNTNSIDYYHTVGRFYCFVPTKDSFADPADGIYFMVYPGNLTLQRANGVANEKQTFLINQTGVSGVGSGLLCQFNTTGTFKFNSSVTVTSMSNLGTYFQGSGAMTLGSAAQLVTQNTGTAILVSGGSIDVGIRSTTRRSFEAYDVAISALPTNQSNRIQLFGQKLNGVLKWWLMDAGGVTAPLLDGRLSTSSADPSTTEFPTSGQWGVHKNTSSGDVFVAVNDGGAIKKVALTS